MNPSKKPEASNDLSVTTGSPLCPFRVGDRIRSKHYGEPATVTAVSETAFEWKLDKPQTLIARDGSWYQTGTCFASGFENYELILENNSGQTAATNAAK